MACFQFDSFEFDTKTRFLTHAGHRIVLSPKGTDLLLVLLQDPGRVISNEELMRRVWSDVSVVESNLHFQISALRNALGKRPDGGQYIQNHPRRGFCLAASVTERRASHRTTEVIEIPPRSDGSGQLLIEPETPPISSWKQRFTSVRWIVRFAFGAGVLVLVTASLAYRLAEKSHLSIIRYIPLTHDDYEKGNQQNLLTDGARVYFEEKLATGSGMAAVPVAGGASGPTPLPDGFPDIYDLSPLTSEALVGHPAAGDTGYELWTISLLGGPARRIGDLRASDAKWSPSRDRIAIALDNGLYIANADGTDRKKLAEAAGLVGDPRWSPDGKRIRFSVATLPVGFSNSIWEVGADGSKPHQILVGWNHPANECCGVWTPDGQFFVFQATREGRTDLWYCPDRTGFLSTDITPVRLTSGIPNFSSPAMSLDGKQVFSVGFENRGELVRYDSRTKAFVRFLGGISATWVNFSKSGRSIVYIRYPDLTVWRSNIDGSGKTQLTFPPLEADGLAWSIDERWLAFRGRTPGKHWNIYVMPTEGAAPKALMPEDKEQAIPTWSPDAARIAFGDVPVFHNRPTGSEEIHVFDMRSGRMEAFPGSHGFWTARWSPDGRFLSALAFDGERLMLYDFGKKTWRSTEAASVNNPTWSPDSRFIYYDTEGHTRALRRVRAADGHVEELVNFDYYPALSWWWSGVSPDGSPLILRNLGDTEIYALELESR